MTTEQNDYHDRRYRDNPPSFVAIAVLAGIGWVIAVECIAWVAS